MQKKTVFCCCLTLFFAGTVIPAYCRLPAYLGPHSPAASAFFGDTKAARAEVDLGDTDYIQGGYPEAKAHYQAALKASREDEDAIYGLARCDAALGDDRAAAQGFEKILYRADAGVLAEYVLVLQHTASVTDVIARYQEAVSRADLGPVGDRISLPLFKADGSDYDAATVAAMAHVIQAVSAAGNPARQDAEISKALQIAPNSSVIYDYKGRLLGKMRRPGAAAAFVKALQFDQGANTAMIEKHLAQAENPPAK